MSTVHRILLIGDDLELSGWLREASSLADCEVQTALGEADALRNLREKAFGVVLTNPISPVGKDLALFKEMRLIRPGLRTIVLAPAATPEEIMAYVAERVAPHERVRHLEVIDQIPKSASGKILRRLLVERERQRVGGA